MFMLRAHTAPYLYTLVVLFSQKKRVCRSWLPHALPHSVRTGYPHTPTQGNTTTLKRRQARRTRARGTFIEPRFLKRKQPQKPHNKLEKAQMMLRENKLNLELKLGGESDNPTSKGIPQPPLWRKSIRGAWSFSWDARQRPRECIARSRFWTRLSSSVTSLGDHSSI